MNIESTKKFSIGNQSIMTDTLEPLNNDYSGEYFKSIADIVFKEKLPELGIFKIVSVIMTPYGQDSIQRSIPGFYKFEEIDEKYKDIKLQKTNINFNKFTLQFPVPSYDKPIYLEDIEFNGQYCQELYKEIEKSIILGENNKGLLYNDNNPITLSGDLNVNTIINLFNKSYFKLSSIYRSEASWIITSNFFEILQKAQQDLSLLNIDFTLIDLNKQTIMGKSFIIIDERKESSTSLLCAFGYFKNGVKLFIGMDNSKYPTKKPVDYMSDGIFCHLTIGADCLSNKESYIVCKTKNELKYEPISKEKNILEQKINIEKEEE